MGGKKNQQEKVVVVEFKVLMHCKACERAVAKIISKFKGVEKFTTDMIKHKVIVTGRINPEKLVKKLKKKTGKRIEIVGSKDATERIDVISEGNPKEGLNPVVCDGWEHCEVFTMFSDENPNACFIM